MSTEIANPKTFEEKITERLKDAMADLVSDEDLKRFIERGIEKALFEQRQIPSRDSWRSSETVPSIVDHAVNKFIEERVWVAVNKWLEENPVKIQAALDAAIQLGVAGCVKRVLDSRFQDIFRMGVSELQSAQLIPIQSPSQQF